MGNEWMMKYTSKEALLTRLRPKSGLLSLFPRHSGYFGPGGQAVMVNYIVDDLDGMLTTLRAGGAQVEDRREESEYGRFGWVTDPEGNRMELWEPPNRPA